MSGPILEYAVGFLFQQHVENPIVNVEKGISIGFSAEILFYLAGGQNGGVIDMLGGRSSRKVVGRFGKSL
jgi:hypothetical protein